MTTPKARPASLDIDQQAPIDISSYDIRAQSLGTHRDSYEALRRIQIEARYRGIEVPKGYEIDYDIEEGMGDVPIAAGHTGRNRRDLAVARI